MFFVRGLLTWVIDTVVICTWVVGISLTLVGTWVVSKGAGGSGFIGMCC